MFEALGDNTKGQRLHQGYRFVAVNAVAHHPRQRGNLGQPAAVVLALDLNRKHHGRTVPSGPALSQATGADAPMLCATRRRRARLIRGR